MQTFIRMRAVKAATGLGRTSLYARIKAGTFPKPVKLGAQASAWVESEVAQWQRERMAERDFRPGTGNKPSNYGNKAV